MLIDRSTAETAGHVRLLEELSIADAEGFVELKRTFRSHESERRRLHNFDSQARPHDWWHFPLEARHQNHQANSTILAPTPARTFVPLSGVSMILTHLI